MRKPCNYMCCGKGCHCDCPITTTQKKECCPDCNMVCDGVTCPCHTQKPLQEGEVVRSTRGPANPTTPSINEIIKEFEGKCAKDDRDGGFIVYIEGYDNADYDMEKMGNWLRTTLTSFEAHIRAEESEKVRKEVWHERNSLVYEAHEGYKKLIPSLLDDVCQSIYKELIDAIEGEKYEFHVAEGFKMSKDVMNAKIDGINEGLKLATQIIKQKQEEKDTGI